MDAGDLRVFEAVARLGGMSRAAIELNTVQSNVTARIRSLEDALGTPLFDRHARGVTPTAAGRRLLPYAGRVASLLAEARRAAVDDGVPKGPLVVGSLETTAAIRLSPVLARYARTWPAVDLVLRTGTTAEMVDAVLRHEVEGAFVCGPVDHPDLDVQPVFSESLALCTPPPETAKGSVRGGGDAFARLPAPPDLKLVVLRAGCSYRQRLEDVLARRGVVGARVLEFGTIEAIVACVAAGVGVTLLPRALAEPARTDGRLAVHPLPRAESEVETVFVRRADTYVSSALAHLVDMARTATHGGRIVAAE